MRIDCRDPKLWREEWLGLKVYDDYTGKKLFPCFFADDVTGEYGVYSTDENGCCNMNGDRTDILRQFGKCKRLRLVWPNWVKPKRL